MVGLTKNAYLVKWVYLFGFTSTTSKPIIF